MSVHARRTPRPAAALFPLAAAAAAVLLTPSPSSAANKNWIGPNGGSWNTAGNWSPSGVPSSTTTDNVTIAPTPTANYSVTLNTNYPTTSLGTVTLNSPNAFLLTLNHTSSSFTLRANSEVIGSTGLAAYNHSAGSNVTTTLTLGESAGATGSYSLSGTASLSASTAYVGSDGTGTFTQSGGTASINSLNVAFQPTAAGSTYQLSGGSLSSTNANIGGITSASNGTFVHTGGTFTLTGGLTLGIESTGYYSLSAGSLSAATVQLGFEGTGSMSQSGGTCNAGDLVVGYIGQGTYALTAGSLTASSVTLGGDTTFNNGGDGQFSISGGTATVAGTLKVYDSPSNISSVNLSGGTLSVASLDLSGNLSLLNWTGGTLRFANGYTIDPSFVLGDSFHLQAGRTLAAGAPATINSVLYLNGGTLAGPAALTNNGSLQGYGTLAQTVTNAPSGNIQVDTGHALTLAAGFTLSNAGVIQLNSGTIAGTGSLANTGILSGPGAVTANLSNTGTIALPDGALSLPSFTNAGLITLDSAAAQLTGGPITNAATLQGRGRVTANLTNTGTTEPVNGVLQLAGSLSNPGTLRATTGNKLLITGSFPTNSGTILLAGGTLDTSGQPLSNTGSITGFGLLSSGTLTNAGSVLLAGGPSTVTAPVVNTASHTFTVQNTPALFTSPVTNNGTFKILNTTATFAAGFSGTAPSAPGSLTVDAAGALLANSISNTAVTNDGAITLRPASQGGSTSTVTSLALGPTSTFDVADNDLFVDYAATSPATTIRQYLLQSHLTSSTASADPQHRLALGYADATAFTGVPSAPAFPDATSLLVTLTYYGDANLDGRVNADDFALIDRAYAKSLPNATWTNGDFNYDGVITALDYLLIDRVYFQQGAPLSPDFLSQRESQFGADYVSQLLTSIPEPTPSSILYPLSSLLFLLPRRRRSR